MTREEAVRELKIFSGTTRIRLSANFWEALNTAISALEQEPCDDVISRAEAEAIFRNARSKLNPSDYKTADEFNTRDLMLLNAEQLIHLLPSLKPQEPKWIPVSERLPEIDEDGYSSYVLVSFSNFTLPCIGQLRKTDGENHWYEGDDEEALDSFGLHVNAWMPLPEPYREERTEE